jgi:hypothetical protein
MAIIAIVILYAENLNANQYALLLVKVTQLVLRHLLAQLLLAQLLQIVILIHGNVIKIKLHHADIKSTNIKMSKFLTKNG